MSTQAITGCESVVESLRFYAEGTLPQSQASTVRMHLKTCRACAREFEEQKQVLSLLGEAYGARSISPDFDSAVDRKVNELKQSPGKAQRLAGMAAQNEQDYEEYEEELALPAENSSWLSFRLSAAPWWGVSLALHALVILLAGLVSMAIELPKTDESVVMVTELVPRKEMKIEEEEKKPEQQNRNALESKQEVPPTDLTSKDLSDIVVPPDILAKAELGDHFETINLDRPDTQSAFGNPDAHMFHSVQGNDEPEGGGGMGGVGGLDDLIGVGGSVSHGTGGGWGGGNGTGVGVGNGAGKGSFGSRNGGGRRLMVKRHGGNPKTEGAVDKALEWLARHQEADGHWDCLKHEGQAEGRTQGINGTAACTGFALLAFLGAGHTEKIGKYKDHVKRGQDWLIKALEEHDKGGKGRYTTLNYTQGIAALALAEACGMSPRNAELRKAAQSAINGVVFGQIKDGPSEYQAWDYTPDGKTNDTSVTGWNVMAIKAAKIAGLTVDPFSFSGAMRWINAGQDLTNAPAGGDAEYWEGGRMAYRGTIQAPNKGAGGNAMMAAATLTRLMVGGERPDHPGVAGPCNLMKKDANLPNKWPGNLYYWYYGTFTMFQKGGDHWKAWNEPMKKVLPDAQRKDGDFDGSWDPLTGGDMGYIWGGRVMSTSLGALCLEVYYRYQKLN